MWEKFKETWLWDQNVKVNTTVNNNTTNVNHTNVKTNSNEKQDIENNTNQNIYNQVNSAFNQSTDVLNKMVSSINQANTAMNKATGNQTNKMGMIEIINDEGSTVMVSQKNVVTQRACLTAAVQSITDLKCDATQKAIIADMVGLTAKQSTDQANAAAASQSTRAQNAASATQLAQSFVSSIFYHQGTVPFEKFCENFRLKEGAVFNTNVTANTTVNNNTYNYNDTNITNNINKELKLRNNQNYCNQSVQNYMTNLSNKAHNIQELSQNLSNNIIQAAEANQLNEIAGIKLINSKGTTVMLDQTNELAQELSTEFTNFVSSAALILSKGDTAVDKKSTNDQETTAKSSNSSNTSQSDDITNDVKVDQTASGAISSMTGPIIGIVIAIVVVCALGGGGLLLFMMMRNKSAAPAYPPPGYPPH